MKIPLLVDIGILYYKAYVKLNYDVEIRHGSIVKPLKDKGFIMLPKHQHILDIPLEGIILKDELHRQAYYIMKDSLPSFYRLLGGIPIIRAKEIKQMTKEERRTRIKEAKKLRDYINKVMLELLLKDEIVVFHFEGGTAYKKETKLKPAILKRLVRIRNDYLLAKGEELYFVPIDFEYEDVHKRHSKITVTVGNPFTASNLEELTENLVNNIKLIKSP